MEGKMGILEGLYKFAINKSAARCLLLKKSLFTAISLPSDCPEPALPELVCWVERTGPAGPFPYCPPAIGKNVNRHIPNPGHSHTGPREPVITRRSRTRLLHGLTGRVPETRAHSGYVPANGPVSGPSPLLEKSVVFGSHVAAVEVNAATVARVALGEERTGRGVAEDAFVLGPEPTEAVPKPETRIWELMFSIAATKLGTKAVRLSSGWVPHVNRTVWVLGSARIRLVSRKTGRIAIRASGPGPRHAFLIILSAGKIN
ncbi:50S ribosomal protein L20 [Striga asiatica]|uniref:50S ribosomal protein L20 n=1 Tax=Striga asiatica TaxID=4170 RepID=A0A5A7RFR7_STRAF|nr:50S ribosomal protein L20 [Striga asiatica]